MTTRWWLDESALPDLVWARLSWGPEGAEILASGGDVYTFESLPEAENWLSEDEYVPFDELLADGDIPPGTRPPA